MVIDGAVNGDHFRGIRAAFAIADVKPVVACDHGSEIACVQVRRT